MQIVINAIFWLALFGLVYAWVSYICTKRAIYLFEQAGAIFVMFSTNVAEIVAFPQDDIDFKLFLVVLQVIGIAFMLYIGKRMWERQHEELKEKIFSSDVEEK